MKNALRRLLKFLHTLGAVGLMGGMAALAAAMILGPAPGGVAGALPPLVALARIAGWIILPSMAVTVVAGLLAIAVTPAFNDAGWVWVKAATGVLVFAGGFHVVGPLQEAVKPGAAALDPAGVARLFIAERNTLLVLLAVSAANIALAVWRPRFSKIPF